MALSIALLCADLLAWLVNGVYAEHYEALAATGTPSLNEAGSPRTVWSRRICGSHVLRRIVTLLVAAGLMAFATPYGPANLWMALRQVSATSITAKSKDWVPLLDVTSLNHVGFFQPLDVWTFLAVVCLAAALLTVARLQN